MRVGVGMAGNAIRRGLVLLVLVMGCAAPPPPVDHNYRLAVEAPSRLASPPLTGRLEIGRLRAESIGQGRQIAYRTTDRPNEIALYAYDHWADPLPVMLQGALGQALREAGVASEVSIPAFRLEADYVLYGRIVAFERVVEGATSRGQVEIEFSIVREEDRSLLLQRTYREEVGASEQTVPSAVAAMSEAFSRIVSSLAADLSRL